MSSQLAPVERRKHDPALVERYKSGHPRPLAAGIFRSFGLGLITGASDAAAPEWRGSGDFPMSFHYVDVGPNVREEEMITDVYLPIKCQSWREPRTTEAPAY
jgi:hypothetical protein